MGQHVAKLFVNDHGLPNLFRGVVACFTQDEKGPLYSIQYDDGDKEDLDPEETREAHSFAQLLEKDNSTEERRLQNQEKKIVSPKFEELIDVIREVGSLGASWTHQWEEGKTKSLKKIKLPFDQSKRIFKPEQLERLKAAVNERIAILG